MQSQDSAPLRQTTSREFLRQQLELRALEPEWGWFEPVTPSAFLGDDPCPSFRIITHDADGNARPELSRTRYDATHPYCPKDAEGKPIRYKCPPRVGSIIYAPLPDSMSLFAAATEKHIAEGEFKAIALNGLGYPVLGIGGVWNWRRDGRLHTDLAQHIHPGDVVNLWIDGDWQTNPDVHKGAFLLMDALRQHGATPQLVVLPAVPGLPKLGIDDLIAMWRQRGLDVATMLATLERRDSIPSPFVVDLKKPLDTAENFRAALYSHEDGPTLVHWQGQFYSWTGQGWTTQADRDDLLRQELYEFVRANGSVPTKANVSSLLDALRAAAQINIREAPAWLDPDTHHGALLPMANGLLELATRWLHPATPRYFNLSWSDVEYDAGASCPRWEQFLQEVYPGDSQARELLQEFLGYTLTDDTSQQKAIALIGAKRSGKGTVARIVRKLIGKASCCEPTLQSMGERFGLQTWIGKKAAIVSDARTSIKNNAQAMVERVLTITGEDSQYVDRKHLPPWEGRLRVKLWMLSNMLPATQDTGAALVSRFLVLNHSVSFYGREDTRLEAQLEAEAAGILNWALDGLRRLRARGHFVQPESGGDRIKDWERQNSPMLAFVEDRCEIGVGHMVPKTELRNAYETWGTSNRVGHSPSESHFTEELRAATDGKVKTGKRIVNGKPTQVFLNVGLKAAKY